MISAIYNAGAAFGPMPQLVATGDFFQGEAVSVIAHDVSTQIVEQNSQTGAWQNNMGQVTFSLTEV